MTTTTVPQRVEGSDVAVLRAPTLGWAVRRTLLAIAILVVAVGGAACLLYASIEPDEEPLPAAKSAPEAVPSQSSRRAAPAVIMPRRV